MERMKNENMYDGISQTSTYLSVSDDELSTYTIHYTLNCVLIDNIIKDNQM